MNARVDTDRPCGRCGQSWIFHDVPWARRCAGWLEPIADLMNQPLAFVMPIFCKGPGCTKLFCPGPVPMTPNQIVAQVRKIGWGAKQMDPPTSWVFTCEEHSEPTP